MADTGLWVFVGLGSLILLVILEQIYIALSRPNERHLQRATAMKRFGQVKAVFYAAFVILIILIVLSKVF